MLLGKKIYITLVMSLFSILGINSYILAQDNNLSELKDVRYDDSTGNINFVFSSKLSLLSTPKINYNDDYFEFVVQDAFVKESSFFDINSSLFSKVGVYPVESNSLGVRIFTDRQTSLDKYQFSSLDFNNNILTFDFDKFKYEQLVVAKTKDSANQLNVTNQETYNPTSTQEETTNTSVVVTAATTMSNSKDTTVSSNTSNEASEADLLSNLSSIKKSLSSSNKEISGSSLKFKDTSSIRSNITSIVIFIVFLSLGCMVLYFLRPAILKRKSSDKMDKLNIKTLAVSNLSSKQKITLIEIAGEKILLGISGNNISFLTKLSQPQLQSEQQRSISFNGYEASNYNNKSNFNSLRSNSMESLDSFKPKVALKEPSAHISGAKYDKETGVSTNFRSKISSKSSELKLSSEKDLIDNYDLNTGDLKKDTQNSRENQEQQKSAIENVTKLIREKLRNLPSMEE